MKRAVSIFLALILTLMCWLPVGAQEYCTCGNEPIVIVEGMNSTPLFINHATAQEKQIFVPLAKDIISTVKGQLLPLARVIADRNWDAFCDSLIPAANQLFEYAKCGPDGNSKYDVYSETFDYSAACGDIPGGAIKDAASREIGANHVYTFVYDWRLDPMDHAQALNDFIDMVLAQTRHRTVSLISVSMGGVVTCAYLQKYGCGKISSLVMTSSAFYGVELIGDLFTGRFDIEMDGLIRLVCEFIPDDTISSLIKNTLNIMNAAGEFDDIQQFFDQFIENCGARVLKEAVTPLFAYMPGIWGLIPEKDFEAAKSLLLDQSANAELIRKIDDYHYNVRIHVEDIINEAINKGMRFAVISNYNLQGAPVGKGYALQNDTVIDTVYTSAGATCALLDRTLPSGYAQAVNCGHNHLSADGIIDASTCRWPEQTWFIKNMFHVGQKDAGNNTDLYIWLATCDTQCYIDSNPEFPQFLEFYDETGMLSPVE